MKRIKYNKFKINNKSNNMLKINKLNNNVISNYNKMI